MQSAFFFLRVLMAGHLMNTYKRLPVTFARGEGAYLFDTDGERYWMPFRVLRCAVSATRTLPSAKRFATFPAPAAHLQSVPD